MILVRIGLATLAVVLALPVMAQTPPAVTHERELIGHTWSGDHDAVVPGFEDLGGGFVRERLAIGFMRGIENRRQWVLIAQREVGRRDRHAIWQATDAVRATARNSDAYIAFSCQVAGAASVDGNGDTGLIGIVGSERVGSDGMLRAELAWHLGEDGKLVSITEPVACVDDAAGI